MDHNASWVYLVCLSCLLCFGCSACGAEDETAVQQMAADMTDEVIDEVIVAPIETGEETLSPEMTAAAAKTREDIKEEIKEAIEASKYRDEYGNSCEKLYLRMEKAYVDCFIKKDDCGFLMDFNENDAFVAYCKKQMKEKFDGLNKIAEGK